MPSPITKMTAHAPAALVNIDARFFLALFAFQSSRRENEESLRRIIVARQAAPGMSALTIQRGPREPSHGVITKNNISSNKRRRRRDAAPATPRSPSARLARVELMNPHPLAAKLALEAR